VIRSAAIARNDVKLKGQEEANIHAKNTGHNVFHLSLGAALQRSEDRRLPSSNPRYLVRMLRRQGCGLRGVIAPALDEQSCSCETR
jgi:hypothetical protein